mmetsp:Transcript_36058/g.84755  ORF Transcript_36058/g.84755 Transcript_36058/m.84755 type:complete len:137 (-) Transcript_36058:32-442(-)
MVAGFPISTDQLVALLEMVAPLNKEIAKARSFLEQKVPYGLFPVKMKIPIAMSVHLCIALPDFELLTEDDPSWWTIPADYQRKSMKDQIDALGDKIEKLVLDEKEKSKALEYSNSAGGAVGERAPIDGIPRPRQDD